jgi:hypothetical protein
MITTMTTTCSAFVPQRTAAVGRGARLRPAAAALLAVFSLAVLVAAAHVHAPQEPAACATCQFTRVDRALLTAPPDLTPTLVPAEPPGVAPAVAAAVTPMHERGRAPPSPFTP